MYGWIVDGISSLFEPISGQKLTECSVNENAREERVKAGPRLQENSGRAAKRSYHSIDTNEGVCKSEVEVKRRKRDVVLSFVKKTVAGVAGLLRLRSPRTISSLHSHYEDSQHVTPMGIDELHTSCITKSEWIMDKPGNERGSKNPFQSSSPPLMRKHSGACLPDRERRGSLQLLPSRPTLRLGTNNVDPVCSGFGHSRCYKPSLTVEEAIRQNNKEHYRRLLEMVSEKYSKNQPLPFNQTRPQSELSSRTEQITARKHFAPGQTASPGVFAWRNPSNPSTKGRWNGVHFKNTFNGPSEDSQPARCAKQKQASELDLSTEVATRLNLVDKAPSAISVSDSCSAHVRYSDEDIPRLSKEMAAEVSCALAQRDPNIVLSAAFKLRITPRDLTTLQEGGWLNDEVINFYLSLVTERNSGQEGGLKVYAFSTFFFPKLQGLGAGQMGGHAAVKRWTKAVDLFLCDLILVPLHLGVHWALAVIDLKSKTVKSYDSMGQRHDDICNLLLLYMKEEHKVKKGRELDDTKWTSCSMKPSDIPQQKNGSDCGVFACKYADYIAKERPLTFKQCHMPLFRKLMIWEILNQKLL